MPPREPDGSNSALFIAQAVYHGTGRLRSGEAWWSPRHVLRRRVGKKQWRYTVGQGQVLGISRRSKFGEVKTAWWKSSRLLRCWGNKSVVGMALITWPFRPTRLQAGDREALAIWRFPRLCRFTKRRSGQGKRCWIETVDRGGSIHARLITNGGSSRQTISADVETAPCDQLGSKSDSLLRRVVTISTHARQCLLWVWVRRRSHNASQRPRGYRRVAGSRRKRGRLVRVWCGGGNGGRGGGRGNRMQIRRVVDR